MMGARSKCPSRSCIQPATDFWFRATVLVGLRRSAEMRDGDPVTLIPGTRRAQVESVDLHVRDARRFRES